MRAFAPKPFDLNDIVVPENVRPALEKIAENVHNVWAASRIAEGWVYGAYVNSEKKETPNLVPYEDLPECEKDYDRNTALATIKMLIKLGYDIIPREP